MAKHYTRNEVVERFKKTIETGSPVVIARRGNRYLRKIC